MEEDQNHMVWELKTNRKRGGRGEEGGRTHKTRIRNERMKEQTTVEKDKNKRGRKERKTQMLGQKWDSDRHCGHNAFVTSWFVFRLVFGVISGPVANEQRTLLSEPYERQEWKARDHLSHHIRIHRKQRAEWVVASGRGGLVFYLEPTASRSQQKFGLFQKTWVGTR